MSHAYFKAILFIAVGNLIHNANNYQDLKCISIQKNFIPFTFRVIIAAKIRLIGFPFIAGFYSKDIFLEISIIQEINFFIWILFYLRTLITVIYRVRFLYIITNTPSIGFPLTFSRDNNNRISYSIIILWFNAVIRGYFLRSNYLPLPEKISWVFLSLEIKNFTLIIISFRSLIYLFISNSKFSFFPQTLTLWSLFYIFSLPIISTQFFVFWTIKLSSLIKKNDALFINLILPNSINLSTLINNNIKHNNSTFLNQIKRFFLIPLILFFFIFINFIF